MTGSKSNKLFSMLVGISNFLITKRPPVSTNESNIYPVYHLVCHDKLVFLDPFLSRGFHFLNCCCFIVPLCFTAQNTAPKTHKSSAITPIISPVMSPAEAPTAQKHRNPNRTTSITVKHISNAVIFQ